MQMQSRAGKSASSHQGGFTLIEVMIVVAIVAILAAFAIPQYREYVLRGQLVSATNLLSTYQARMERHFQDNRSYETVGAFDTPCDAPEEQRTDEHFVLTCEALTPTSFTLLATGSGPALGFQFRLITDGAVVRSTVGPAGWGDCANRWILRRGAACNP